MADGYARVRSGLGVVVATSGGGAMNLVAGLSESFESRVPVLALVGQPPTPLEGGGAFQDTSGRAGTIDATTLFGAITRYCARVDDPADIADQLRRAVTAALSGGPAVLLLPKNIQQAEVDLPPFVPPPIRHAHDTTRLLRLRSSLAHRWRTGKIVIVAEERRPATTPVPNFAISPRPSTPPWVCCPTRRTCTGRTTRATAVSPALWGIPNSETRLPIVGCVPVRRYPDARDRARRSRSGVRGDDFAEHRCGCPVRRRPHA